MTASPVVRGTPLLKRPGLAPLGWGRITQGAADTWVASASQPGGKGLVTRKLARALWHAVRCLRYRGRRCVFIVRSDAVHRSRPPDEPLLLLRLYLILLALNFPGQLLSLEPLCCFADGNEHLFTDLLWTEATQRVWRARGEQGGRGRGRGGGGADMGQKDSHREAR